MPNIFFYLQKKRMVRSTIWQRNLALNIVLGFFLFIMLAELLGVGFYLDVLLTKSTVHQPANTALALDLIYYFLITFVLRFFIQELPTLEIAPLLHLPIKKRSISLFLNARSLLSFFNFVPFFLFLPFAFKYMIPKFGPGQAFLWFAAIFLFEMTSNYLLVWFKRQFSVKPVVVIVLFGLAVIIFLLEKYHIFSLSVISGAYFSELLRQPAWIVLPLFTAVVFFSVNYRVNLSHLYLEDLTKRKKEGERLSKRFSGLESFGITGTLMLNEIRLLFRNKRSKSIIFLTPFLLLYGLLFYTGKDSGSTFLLIFVGIMISGAFMIPYGQYILAWESKQFDFILANNISTYEYFKAKFYILVVPTTLVFILSIPYVYFGNRVLWINTAMFVYNIGVNSLLLLFTASFNRKRMELEKRQMMNYQGIGINNFLNAIPLIFFPWLLFVVYKSIFNESTAIWLILITGLLGLLFHRYFIRLAVKFFQKNRYKIATGFRQS